MDGQDSKRREDLFSKPVKAGKRTYFFDVKATRSGEYYLTITESKRRMDDGGKFHYDKHKLFLYKEDFEKFSDGFAEAMAFIKNEKGEDYGARVSDDADNAEKRGSSHQASAPSTNGDNYSSNISFDDLGDDK